ncbi:MAG: DUF2505 family protein [Deltaproteobacteria bacterium]|nr:DUF2505 family protein [Deltaproteobacteria bacterium]
MTKTYKFNDRFDASRDRIQELLTDPELRKSEALDVARSLEASCELTEPRPGIKRLVVKEKEYARGMDGKKDTSRTEDITLTIDWDTSAYRCDWTWMMASQAKRVFVSGTTTLLPVGDGCTVIEEGRVEVKVPVIGKMIEGKVVGGIEKARPRWVAWFKEKL